MAAAEVIVVDNSLSLPHQQCTERIERVLEMWYKDLRVNIVNEFLHFKSSVENKQQRTISEIQNKTSPEVVKLRREIENLRELLHTLERSVSQKDKLVSNLVKSLEKEKDKYEKLRAVSSDKFKSALDESDENSVAAEKQYNKKLLAKCWLAWREMVQLKDRSDNVDNTESTELVTVKTEEGLASRDSPFSDDISLGSENEEAENMNYGQSTSSSEEKSYPAYQTTSMAVDCHTSQETSVAPGSTQSFIIVNNRQETNENGSMNGTFTSSAEVSTRRRQTVAVASRPPSTGPFLAKVRKRHRTYIKDRIKIKKVQSLRDGTSFLTSDGRPTMATNVFQVQSENNEAATLQPTSLAPTVHILPSDESYANQNIIMNPNEQNSDMSQTVVHVQPQFGLNQSDWETAKNNISQYMNQMLNKTGDTKEVCRKGSETTALQDVANAVGDNPEQMESQVANSLNQTATSTSQVQQETGEGKPCTVCNEVVPAWSFKKHKRSCKRRNPTNNEKWTCKDCGKSFISGKRYLEDHILSVHMGTPPYECSICGRGFASYNNFKRHMLVHSGDRPFKCNICTKSFNQYCNLARHRMRLHNITKDEGLSVDNK